MRRIVEFIALLLLKLLVGSESKCSDQLHVWPLSEGTGTSDLISGQSASSGRLQYQDGTSPFNYKTLNFTGATNAYVDLQINNPSPDIEDYSLQLFLYLSSLNGVIFHYKSTGSPIESDYITDILAEIKNGNVVLLFSNGGFVDMKTNLQTGTWYRLILERDENKEFELLVNNTKYDESANVSLKDMPTQFPGTLRLGMSHSDMDPLEGSIACIQLHPCRDIDDITMDACVMPTTTAEPTTSTTSTVTVPSSTNLPVTMHIAVEYDVTVSCTHYSLTHPDTTFTYPADVIEEVHGLDVRSCSILCNIKSDCSTFVIQNYNSANPICKIGKKTTSTTPETGSAMFIRM